MERTIAPGSYGDITVQRDRILRLEPGDYYFRNLNVDSQGILIGSAGLGGVRIYVENSLMVKGAVYGEGPLFLGYLGTSGTFIDSDMAATVVAPNAHISVSPGKLYVGSIFAKNVTMHQDSTFQHNPYNGSWCP